MRPSRWYYFKRDLKERFLNFETLKGAYMIPAGAAICYVTIYHLQYIIQAVGLLFGWYVVSEGLRKVFVNRVKQRARFNRMVENREAERNVR